MLKRQDTFTETFTIFFIWKHTRIQIWHILEDHFFRWYKCNIYIVKTSALDFKEVYII